MVFTYSGRHTFFSARKVDSLENRLGSNLTPIPPDSLREFHITPYISQVGFGLPAGVETLTLPPLPGPVVYAPIEVPPIDIRVAGIWNSEIHSLLKAWDFGEYPQLWDLYVFIIPTNAGFFFPLAIPRSASLTFSENGEPLRVELQFISSHVVIFPPDTAEEPQPPADPAPQIVNNIRTILSLPTDNPLAHPRKVLSLSVNLNTQLTPLHTMPADTWRDTDTHIRTPRLFAAGYTTVEAGLRTYSQPLVSPEELNGIVLECRLQGYDKDISTKLLDFKLKGVVTASRTTVEVGQAVIWDVSLSAFGSPTTPPISWEN